MPALGVRTEVGRLAADYKRTWNLTGESGRRFLIGGLLYLARTTGYSVAFPLYARARGYDPGDIGVFYAATQFALFVLGIPITILGSRGLSRQILALGPIVAALGIFTILLAPDGSWDVTLVGAFLAGASGATFWVLGDPLLAATTPASERAHVYALKFFLVTLGVSIGGGIGGWVPGALESVGSISTESALAFTLLLFAGFDVLQTVCFASIPPYEQPHSERPKRAGPAASIFTRVNLGLFLVMLAVAAPELGMALGHTSIRPFLSLFLTDEQHRSTSQTGTILAVLGLLAGVGALLTPRLANRLGNVRAIAVIRITGAASILLWFSGVGFGAVLGLMVLYYFLMDGTEALYITEAMGRMSTDLRTWLSCIYSMGWSLAAAIASVVSGWIQEADDGHFGKAFAVGAFGYLFSVVWMLLVFPRLPNISRRDFSQSGVARVDLDDRATVGPS